MTRREIEALLIGSILVGTIASIAGMKVGVALGKDDVLRARADGMVVFCVAPERAEGFKLNAGEAISIPACEKPPAGPKPKCRARIRGMGYSELLNERNTVIWSGGITDDTVDDVRDAAEELGCEMVIE